MATRQRSSDSSVVVLAAGPASVAIDLTAGARLSSLRVWGNELLVQRSVDNHPFGWGSYAMVPFAGRLREGRLSFNGRDHDLPVNMAPHAIHGTGFDNTWQLFLATRNVAVVGYRLTDPWPFAGTVTHHVELHADRLVQQLTVTSSEDQPVSIGWHPWFRRRIETGDALELDLDLHNAKRYVKDGSGLPTGKLAAVAPRPWDDCFIGVGRIGLLWPGALRVDVVHDCDHVVMYDPPHAICIEPQTAPPDACHLVPAQVTLLAGEVLERTVTWRWSLASRR